MAAMPFIACNPAAYEQAWSEYLRGTREARPIRTDFGVRVADADAIRAAAVAHVAAETPELLPENRYRSAYAAWLDDQESERPNRRAFGLRADVAEVIRQMSKYAHADPARKRDERSAMRYRTAYAAWLVEGGLAPDPVAFGLDDAEAHQAVSAYGPLQQSIVWMVEIERNGNRERLAVSSASDAETAASLALARAGDDARLVGSPLPVPLL